jgi:hypothetical protein
MTEQAASTPTPADEEARVNAAVDAAIERLEELGLRDELGRVVVEPAAAFRWS